MAVLRDDRYYMRDPRLVAVGRRERFLFCRDGAVHTHDGVDGPSMSWVLERLVAPTSGRDAFAPIRRGDVGDDVRETIEALVDAGGVLEADHDDHLASERDRAMIANQGYNLRTGEPQCTQLVLGMTGSVIAGLMGPYVLSLAFSRFQRELDLVFTEASKSFVQPELFEFYGLRTWSDAFVRREGRTVPHIALAKSSDLVAIMPATAGSISRLASGSCSDLLSLVAIATTAPVVVAPTMNTAMWDNPAVRRNVDQLRADGVYVIEPTFFFEAAELIKGAPPLCGMLGVFWGGPSALIHVLSTVLDDARGGAPVSG